MSNPFIDSQVMDNPCFKCLIVEDITIHFCPQRGFLELGIHDIKQIIGELFPGLDIGFCSNNMAEWLIKC